MPDGVRWTRPGGGPTLWLEIPRSVPYEVLEPTSRAAASTSRMRARRSSATPHLHGFRLAYAYLSERRDAQRADDRRRRLACARPLSNASGDACRRLARACCVQLRACSDERLLRHHDRAAARADVESSPGMSVDEAIRLVPGLHVPDRKGVRDELVLDSNVSDVALDGAARRRHGVGHRRDRARPQRARAPDARVGRAADRARFARPARGHVGERVDRLEGQARLPRAQLPRRVLAVPRADARVLRQPRRCRRAISRSCARA